MTAQPSPDQADLYREAAVAMVPWAQQDPDYEDLFEYRSCEPTCGRCACSGVPYPSAAVRAAVDRVAELVRAEVLDGVLNGYEHAMGEQLDRLVVERDNARAEIQRLTVERDLAIAHDRQPYPTADAYERACATLNRHRERAETAEADLAAMTARAERMRLVLVAARSWLAQETNGRGISPADDRLITTLRAYDETEPLWALSATETGPGPSDVDQSGSEGQRGAEGGSGARAPLPARFADDPIGRRLLDMPHEYRQHDELDIPVCVCGWGWGSAVHGGPDREARP